MEDRRYCVCKYFLLTRAIGEKTKIWIMIRQAALGKRSHLKILTCKLDSKSHTSVTFKLGKLGHF